MSNTDRGTPLNLPGKENGPRPDTKLLLGALIFNKSLTRLKIKKQYEDVNLKKNKLPAEYQGHIFYPSKSFEALQNLVRLSL